MESIDEAVEDAISALENDFTPANVNASFRNHSFPAPISFST